MRPANFAPFYAACLYPQMAEIARSHGYALSVHGSLAKDMDIVCIPWREEGNPSQPSEVVAELTKKFAIEMVGDEPSRKNHGRLVYTISVGFGECYVDLSFLPFCDGFEYPAKYIGTARPKKWGDSVREQESSDA